MSRRRNSMRGVGLWSHESGLQTDIGSGEIANPDSGVGEVGAGVGCCSAACCWDSWRWPVTRQETEESALVVREKPGRGSEPDALCPSPRSRWSRNLQKELRECVRTTPNGRARKVHAVTRKNGPTNHPIPQKCVPPPNANAGKHNGF